MPLLLLLGQSSTTVTVGGTAQLASFGSSGSVVGGNTVGGTVQLAGFTATGGIYVSPLITVGGTIQIGQFTSTGGVDSGGVPTESGIVGKNRTISIKSLNRSITRS